MGVIRLDKAPHLEVTLRRSARARRISLRVSSLDGRVTLTLPAGTPERVGRAFAEEKADWIGRAVQKVGEPLAVTLGTELPLGGRPHRIVVGRGCAATVGEGAIFAPAGREGPAVEALLKHLARDRLAAAVTRHAGALGATPGRLTLRDTRSRWGSCASSGKLMFSWRLVMAPPEVLDYVAAHEVAHLAEMNHSPAFWQQVERLMPGYRPPRRWLRENGALLHRYKFGD